MQLMQATNLSGRYPVNQSHFIFSASNTLAQDLPHMLQITGLSFPFEELPLCMRSPTFQRFILAATKRAADCIVLGLGEFARVRLLLDDWLVGVASGRSDCRSLELRRPQHAWLLAVSKVLVACSAFFLSQSFSPSGNCLFHPRNTVLSGAFAPHMPIIGGLR